MASDNFTRLEQLIEFNPSKQQAPTSSILAKVMGELKEERSRAAEAQARKVLTDAMALHEGYTKTKRAFQKEEERFNKELGKLVNMLEAFKRGAEAPSSEEGGEAPST